MQRDNRGTIIKGIIKKAYPSATVRVRLDKYSMGESINVRTDAFKIDQVADPRGYGYINDISEKDKAIRDNIKRLLSEFESIDRDSATGEILSGGNTYLFIGELN
jgi:hypothetical protein